MSGNAKGADSRRRRDLLAGAAAVVGVITGEALASAPPARAAEGAAVLLGQDNTGATGRTGLSTTGSESAVLADPATHIGVHGTGAESGSGVFGVGGSAGGDGVTGIGSGAGSGVVGTGGARGASGVVGIGGGNGAGLFGIGTGSGAGVAGRLVRGELGPGQSRVRGVVGEDGALD